MGRLWLLMTLLLLGMCILIEAHGDHEHGHHHHHHDDDDDADDVEEDRQAASSKSGSDLPKLDPEEVEYHKGSLCGYCEYCRVIVFFNMLHIFFIYSSNN